MTLLAKKCPGCDTQHPLTDARVCPTCGRVQEDNEPTLLGAIAEASGSELLAAVDAAREPAIEWHKTPGKNEMYEAGHGAARLYVWAEDWNPAKAGLWIVTCNLVGLVGYTLVADGAAAAKVRALELVAEYAGRQISQLAQLRKACQP